jgi:hypothetical protein
MRRDLMASLTVGLVLAVAPLHQVQAGERHGAGRPGAMQLVAVMSGGRSNFHPAVARSQGNAAGEYSFSVVSPLASRSVVRPQAELGNEPGERKASGVRQAKQAGPATIPSERKTLTFFRLNGKFGDVSVQPVVGGVNGAQLSLGF